MVPGHAFGMAKPKLESDEPTASYSCCRWLFVFPGWLAVARSFPQESSHYDRHSGLGTYSVCRPLSWPLAGFFQSAHDQNMFEPSTDSLEAEGVTVAIRHQQLSDRDWHASFPSCHSQNPADAGVLCRRG